MRDPSAVAPSHLPLGPMADNSSLWYRIGYALERGRKAPPPARKPLAGLAERVHREPDPSRPAGAPWPTVEEFIDSGITSMLGGALAAWKPRRRTHFIRLLSAGAAGAGAALLLDLGRPLLRGERTLGRVDEGTLDRLLAGFGQGLVYGGVVEPRLLGPAVLKGALYGSVEYFADAFGGLPHVLGAHAPQRRLPLLGRFLEDVDPHDRAFLEHLVFGVALALLYGVAPKSSGMSGDPERDGAGSSESDA